MSTFMTAEDALLKEIQVLKQQVAYWKLSFNKQLEASRATS